MSDDDCTHCYLRQLFVVAPTGHIWRTPQYFNCILSATTGNILRSEQWKTFSAIHYAYFRFIFGLLLRRNGKRFTCELLIS